MKNLSGMANEALASRLYVIPVPPHPGVEEERIYRKLLNLSQLGGCIWHLIPYVPPPFFRTHPLGVIPAGRGESDKKMFLTMEKEEIFPEENWSSEAGVPVKA